METPIDPHNMRAEIELLQGQTRAMRSVMAAIILAQGNNSKIASVLAFMQADLQVLLNQSPRDDNHRRQLANWRNGAESAMRDLQDMLRNVAPPG